MTRNGPIAATLFVAAALFAGCDREVRDHTSPHDAALFKKDSTPRPGPASIGRSGRPDCGRIDVATDDYGSRIAPTSGPPGTKVTLWGTTVRGEDGRWAPSNRLEAWWDTEVPDLGIKLVEVDDMERCHFETSFLVPHVEPGRYKISVFSWFANPEDGYGLHLPHHFTVTPY